MSHVFDPKAPALQPVRSRRRTLALVGLWTAAVASFGVFVLAAIVSTSIPLAGDGIQFAGLAGALLTGRGLRSRLVRPAPMTSEARSVARGLQIFCFVLLAAIAATFAVLDLTHRAELWYLPVGIATFLGYLGIVVLSYRANLWHWRDEHRDR